MSAEPSRTDAGPLRQERRPSSVCATGTVDPAPRMGTGGSQKQAAHESSGSSQAWNRPEDQLLVKLRRPSIYGAPVQVGIVLFEFRWSKDMAPANGGTESGGELFYPVFESVRNGLLVVGIPLS